MNTSLERMRQQAEAHKIFEQEQKTKMEPMDGDKLFNSYIEELHIDIDSLKDKAVLDVGSGSNPRFVARLLDDNLVKSAYAIDSTEFLSGYKYYTEKYKKKNPKENLEKSKVVENYIQGSADNLPFKSESFDLVLSRALIVPDTISGVKFDIDKIFSEAERVLKPGGEFKIYPVHRGSDIRREIDLFLSELESNDFVYEWSEGEKNEIGGKVSFKDLLVIRKKEEN